MKTHLESGNARLFNKVPQVTFFFWVIKIMATTVGETAADFLNFNLHLGLTKTSIIMGLLLLISLVIQVLSKKYIPWKYWLAVVLISVFGTLVTDNLVDNYGVTLKTTTIIFSAALLASFTAWFASEKTLSIHSIFSKKRELFYWIVILFTFALGTAAGDLVAEGMRLGYATSAFAFAAAISLVALAYYVFKLNAIVAFWFAYVLTRPFGASCGDLLSQPAKYGGLGLGTTVTSLVFLVIIIGLITYFSLNKNDD